MLELRDQGEFFHIKVSAILNAEYGENFFMNLKTFQLLI